MLVHNSLIDDYMELTSAKTFLLYVKWNILNRMKHVPDTSHSDHRLFLVYGLQKLPAPAVQQ